jgi:hypothetical protein
MSTSAHIPFSDAPERKSPIAVIAPWLIAAVVIAVGAYLFLRLTEAPPVAEGKITKLFAIEQQGAERVIAGVEISLRNAYDKEIIVRGINAKLVTADGQEQTDQAAAAGDHARYFQAIPQLKQSDAPPLAFDTKLAPGQQLTGLAMFTFPVTKDGFDKRKSLDVRIDFYGMKPVTLHP